MRTAVGFGCLLIAVGLSALVWDLYFLTLGGHVKLSSWGEFWYGVHSASLGAVKTGIESHLPAGLWAWTMGPLLKVPALLLFGLPGAILASLPWTLPKLRDMRALRQA
ncbi:MAG: hypothetical protein OEU09_08770 [Rhodospirillales bacterium]|nr:hypothetical protein [Rhodospirillales bacterium]MDH3911375.1 hypothetical protein [Rhodospirillales bacterium]MDH3967873.1 hypothetical protein [Rhodospirillales bacterium]